MALIIGASLGDIDVYTSSAEAGDGRGIADTDVYAPSVDGTAMTLHAGINTFASGVSCSFVLYEQAESGADFLPVLTVTIPIGTSAPQQISLSEGFAISANSLYKGAYYANSSDEETAFDVAINTSTGGNYPISGSFDRPLSPLMEDDLTEEGILYWGLDDALIDSEPKDALPDAIVIAPLVNQPLNTAVTFPAITIEGINTEVAISIVGGLYSIGGAAFTSSNGVVVNGQTLVVQMLTSSLAGGEALATVTIGGVLFEYRTVSTSTINPVGVTFLRGQLNIYPYDAAAADDALAIFQGNSMELVLENVLRGFTDVAESAAEVLASIAGPEGEAVEGLKRTHALELVDGTANVYAFDIPASAGFVVGEIYSLNVVATAEDGSAGQWFTRIQVAQRTLQIEKRLTSRLLG